MYTGTALVLQIVGHSLQFCCLVVCVYGCISVWKRRHESFVRKRCLPLVLANQGAIALLSITQAIWLVFQAEANITRSHIAVAYTLMNIALWLLLWLLLTKTWMIYFTVHWIQDSLQSSWRCHINQREFTPSWFLQNLNKYGQMHRMLLIFGITMFISFAIYQPVVVYNVLQKKMTLDWLSFLIGVTVYVPAFFGPFVFYGFLIRKTPSFDDHLFIQWESNTI